MLIGNLRRVRREFGNVDSFRIVPFRFLCSPVYKGLQIDKLGSSPVYASGSTSEEKAHYSKRTVFWSSWVFTLAASFKRCCQGCRVPVSWRGFSECWILRTSYKAVTEASPKALG
ncbi:hypothetical protein DPMN_034273 [Dreissena polymorpha]|uniref:Uncharacterized protein n=1 Tax=Dreissena polymorpha TaxID=45954 RepID=A0A9D4RJX9_DREPO|nr:hypothetical protein DPMN_034273 [Dreissena polymorpha]